MLAIFLILSACQAIVPTSSSDDFDFKSKEADVPYEDDYEYYADYDDDEYNEGLQRWTTPKVMPDSKKYKFDRMKVKTTNQSPNTHIKFT